MGEGCNHHNRNECHDGQECLHSEGSLWYDCYCCVHVPIAPCPWLSCWLRCLLHCVDVQCSIHPYRSWPWDKEHTVGTPACTGTSAWEEPEEYAGMRSRKGPRVATASLGSSSVDDEGHAAMNSLTSSSRSLAPDMWGFANPFTPEARITKTSITTTLTCWSRRCFTICCHTENIGGYNIVVHDSNSRCDAMSNCHAPGPYYLFNIRWPVHEISA